MPLISEKMNEALNSQIKKELDSAYIYLSMSYWLKEHSYKNLENWYTLQTQEEWAHAQKFINYLIEVGGKVALPTISAPKQDWKNVEEIVKTAYAHEQYITGTIHDLVTLAEELKEYAPREMLQWFVSEQIEEEASSGELVTRQAGFQNDYLFDQHTSRAAPSEE